MGSIVKLNGSVEEGASAHCVRQVSILNWMMVNLEVFYWLMFSLFQTGSLKKLLKNKNGWTSRNWPNIKWRKRQNAKEYIGFYRNRKLMVWHLIYGRLGWLGRQINYPTSSFLFSFIKTKALLRSFGFWGKPRKEMDYDKKKKRKGAENVQHGRVSFFLYVSRSSVLIAHNAQTPPSKFWFLCIPKQQENENNHFGLVFGWSWKDSCSRRMDKSTRLVQEGRTMRLIHPCFKMVQFYPENLVYE